MPKKILIIDDDVKLNRLLASFLKDFGYDVLSAAHPDKGLKLLKRKKPDLLILDIMLPDVNGFEICKQIRRTSQIPIIMLTARGEVTDRVIGLEVGADDYLPKPFEPRELVARIQSVLRRSQFLVGSQKQRFERLIIDFASRKVTLDGLPLELTTNEYATLVLLTQNAGRVLDRDQILQHLSGIDCDAFNRSVDITVSRLRQKLGDDPKHPVYIKTIWGAGYVFIGQEGND